MGLFVYGAGSAVSLKDSLISDVGTSTTLAGTGVVGMAGTLTQLSATDVRHSAIGLAFDGASAGVEGGVVSDNSIAVNAQGGSTLEVLDLLPATLGTSQVVFSQATRFERNETQVGSGTVPLPSPF